MSCDLSLDEALDLLGLASLLLCDRAIQWSRCRTSLGERRSEEALHQASVTYARAQWLCASMTPGQPLTDDLEMVVAHELTIWDAVQRRIDLEDLRAAYRGRAAQR